MDINNNSAAEKRSNGGYAAIAAARSQRPSGDVGNNKYADLEQRYQNAMARASIRQCATICGALIDTVMNGKTVCIPDAETLEIWDTYVAEYAQAARLQWLQFQEQCKCPRKRGRFGASYRQVARKLIRQSRREKL